jgi:hypothetical protein
MSDQLTFSWFVGTCNLGHPATGPQEALWNMVKGIVQRFIREAHSMRASKLEAQPFFFLNLKGTTSQEEHETILSGLKINDGFV